MCLCPWRLLHGTDGGCHVRCFEGGGAGDQTVGSGLPAEGGLPGADPAVHLDEVMEVALCALCVEEAYFVQDVFHEALASKAGDDAHHQDHVGFGEVGQKLADGGGGVDGKPGLGAACTDGGQGGVEVDVAFAFDVDGDHVHAGFEEAGQVVIRCVDHEVGIQVGVGGYAGPDGSADVGPEGDVVHEGAVHDVQVQPVGSGLQCPVGFPAYVAEVTG